MSHDIKGLPTGQARLAGLLDRQGKIVFTALVHACEEELLLETIPEEMEKVRRSLERYLVSDRVEFAEVTGEYKIIALHGPAIPDLLETLWPGLFPASSLQSKAAVASSGIRRIARWDLLRLPGFHLWVAPEAAVELQKSLAGHGNRLGIVETNWDAFEVLRIEAGAPWPGHELCESVILNELGSEEFVSFTKGCFIGQEIVARIKYRGHPPRLLTGFLLEGKEPASPGRPVRTTDSAQEVGVVTSSCFSPALKQPIALGFLQYGRSETTFQVPTPQGDCRATVTALPFV